MAEPHWTGYAGMITGVIGAITGISGAVMGYLGYRHSKKLKALDLRLELQKALNEVDLLSDGIENFLDRVNKSHERVMAARGMANSGAWQLWQQEFAQDKVSLGALLVGRLQPEGSYEHLTPDELESRVVTVDRFRGGLEKIRGKYSSILEEDDEKRRHLRDGARHRTPGA